MAETLDIEFVKPEPTQHLLGHRIGDLGYVLSWALPLQQEHSKRCTLGKLSVTGESQNGLITIITFECDGCGMKLERSTEKPGEPKSVINFGAVWGTLSTGSTYTHLKELSGVMDIPCMSYRLFHNIEMQLGEAWKDDIFKSMEKAGQDERELAFLCRRKMKYINTDYMCSIRSL